MKKVFLTLSLALVALVACTKNDEPTQNTGETTEAYIDATSKTAWNYYSLTEGKVVGTGAETSADNAKWFVRTDWDFAVNRYMIRTNSGAATTTGAKGGVYTFPVSMTFSSVTALPKAIQLVADKAITAEGMGGTTTTIKSEAEVILFKKNADGSSIMPPVYLQAPVYIFRTADGAQYYKVQFTQYQDANKVSGHVKFYSAQIK